jgi:hypothetical protein
VKRTISPGCRPVSRTIPHQILPSYSTAYHPRIRLTRMRLASDQRQGLGRLDAINASGGLDLEDGELERKGARWRV